MMMMMMMQYTDLIRNGCNHSQRQRQAIAWRLWIGTTWRNKDGKRQKKTNHIHHAEIASLLLGRRRKHPERNPEKNETEDAVGGCGNECRRSKAWKEEASRESKARYLSFFEERRNSH